MMASGRRRLAVESELRALADLRSPRLESYCSSMPANRRWARWKRVFIFPIFESSSHAYRVTLSVQLDHMEVSRFDNHHSSRKSVDPCRA